MVGYDKELESSIHAGRKAYMHTSGLCKFSIEKFFVIS